LNVENKGREGSLLGWGTVARQNPE